MKWSLYHLSRVLQIDEDITYKDKLELLKKFKFVKFCNIFTNFAISSLILQYLH